MITIPAVIIISTTLITNLTVMILSLIDVLCLIQRDNMSFKRYLHVPLSSGHSREIRHSVQSSFHFNQC